MSNKRIHKNIMMIKCTCDPGNIKKLDAAKIVSSRYVNLSRLQKMNESVMQNHGSGIDTRR